MESAPIVVGVVRAKRTRLGSRRLQALVLALLLVTVPHVAARADHTPAMTRPLPTAEAPAQCCRICRKGRPWGDACISATRQCRKE
jgi:hypothetical protein